MATTALLAAPASAGAFTLEYSLGAQQAGATPGLFVAPALDLPLRIVASTSGGANASTQTCDVAWSVPPTPPNDFSRGLCTFSFTDPQGRNFSGVTFEVRVEATMPSSLRSYAWNRPVPPRSDDLICPSGVTDRTVVTLTARLGARPTCRLDLVVTGEPPDDCPTGANVIRGTEGPDVLTGTAGRDVICGLGGDDLLRGLDGDDRLIGGAGEDVLIGGAGRDVLVGTGDSLFGGAGNDTLRDSGGSALITGGRGSDIIEAPGATTFGAWGCAGDDVIGGGPGRQVINGDYLLVPSADAVSAIGLAGVSGEDVQCDRALDAPAGAAPGADTLRGLGGADLIDGGPGGDDVFGGAGADRLRGAGGRDLIEGGGGDDIVVGGPGDDLSLEGGAGDDQIVGCGGRDLIEGEAGRDRLWGDRSVPAREGCAPDTDDPDPGADTPSADRLLGGPGNDDLFGGDGNDALNGGAGRDDMRGGSGSDGLLARDGARDRRVNGGRGCDEGTLDRADRRISVESSNLDGSAAVCPRPAGPLPPRPRRD